MQTWLGTRCKKNSQAPLASAGSVLRLFAPCQQGCLWHELYMPSSKLRKASS